MGVLTDKLERFFSAAVRARGHTYFRGGRVRRLKIHPAGGVDAVVKGSADYDVSIDVESHSDSWTLFANCTCPYSASIGGFCKHIWAVLLALEEDGRVSQLGVVPARVHLKFMDDERLSAADLDDDLWDGDAVSRTAAAFSRPLRLLSQAAQNLGPRPRPQRTQAPPQWLRLFQELPPPRNTIPAVSHRAPAEIEPLYVLEAEESRLFGALVLGLAQQRPTATGKLGKVKRLSVSLADVLRMPALVDRTICLMLLGAGAPDPGYGYYAAYGRTGASQWKIPPEMHQELLPLLHDSGRFRLRRDRASEPVPLTSDTGEPWELVLSVMPAEAPGRHVLLGRFRRGAESCSLDDVACVLAGQPTWFVRDGRLSRLELHDCFPWIRALRQHGPQPIQKQDLPKLLAEFERVRAFPPLEWPADWNVTEVTGVTPRPQLALKIEERSVYGRAGWAHAQVTFHYGDAAVASLTPGCWLTDRQANRLIRRQPDAERRLLARLMEFGVRPMAYGDGFEAPLKRLPELIGRLLTEGWTILGDRNLYRRPGEFKISVSSGIDWFELHGQVDFDGQVATLPELLAALRKGERFVRLGDGSVGMLPEQWLAQHHAWLAMGHAEDGHVRFAKTQLGLIDALLSELPEATFDANLAAAREKLRGFSGLTACPEPAGFVGRLREYQREGLGWLHFLREFDWGGCLADDMGLGKTVQLLALLADRKNHGDPGPSLVVAPKSVIFNWQREAERFTPSLRVLSYTGLERKQFCEDIAGSDLVLTTYGTLRQDLEFLREQAFSYVVLDEAQAVKNPDSQSAKAARLLHARHRLVMTGTPVENHLGDLWSLFEFLNPGMLGSGRAFKSAFGNGRVADDAPPNIPLLQRILRPFILRRTKDQVTPELPQRSEQTVECEMGPKQAAYYKELRDHYRASLLSRVAKVGLAKSKIHVLEALLRLRQAACHPGLIDESKTAADSAKLETLLAMVTELVAEGHKALVFSQFTSLLAIVRAALDRRGVVYEYLDGQTRARDRCVDRFQSDPHCPLFLISLKAGGTGLNLTAADYVFILDPWWNPAVEAQAIDRTHRIGQDKKVIAYRLLARDTVEDKIVQLQQSKRELASAIITQDNSLIRNLTRDDLALLLS